MKILFITRKYPPSVGGMETVSLGLTQALAPDVTVLALRQRSQLHLLWWLPYVLLRGWWLGRSVDVIHLGDGVLAGLGAILHCLTKQPVTITLHGLDVTYTAWGYQRYLQWALPTLSRLIAVSPATAQTIKQRFQLIAVVISNGVTVEDWPENNALGNNHCLLFVGRLVERKGCGWFIKHVLPQLPNIHLHIVGTGPELMADKALVSQLKLEDRVRFHGQVSDADLRRHYCNAQALIMPNISLPNNMEGFGVVALEAGACGLPVLAANMEGIRSTVIDGRTGFLVESESIADWVQAVTHIITAPLSAHTVRQQVGQRFNWQCIGDQYRAVFNTCVNLK